jgi:hypothetical protein
MNQDAEHLRLLSIFHYIVGGLAALFSFFPLLYTTVGAIFIFVARHGTPKPGEELPPEFIGWIFAVRFALVSTRDCNRDLHLNRGSLTRETHSLLVRIRYGLHRMPLHSLRNNSWRIHDHRPFTRIREDVVSDWRGSTPLRNWPRPVYAEKCDCLTKIVQLRRIRNLISST